MALLMLVVVFGTMGSAEAVTVTDTTPTVASSTGSAWTNPNNALSQNNVTADWKNTDQSYLVLTGFDFSSIPTGAQIDGITVRVRGMHSSTAANYRDYQVALTKDGSTPAGTIKVSSTETPVTTFAQTLADFDLGSGTDLWGTTWTDADVKSANFGVMLTDNDATATGTNPGYSIDVMYITVDYTVVCSDTIPSNLTITVPPANNSTVGGNVTITATADEAMNNMTVTIAGSSACNAAGQPMSGTGPYTYSWNTGACGTSAPENPITITVNGNEPQCNNAQQAQWTNITIDNTCTAAQVTGLSAGSATTTSVSLSWNHPTTNVNYYNVYRDSVKISTDGNVTTGSFNDGGPLTPGQNYAYYVRGYNTAGTCEGQASSTINKSTLAETPAAPIATNTGTGTSANVTIASDSNGADTSYAIRINGGVFADQFVQADGSVGASAVWQTKAAWSTITVTGLTNNTTYTFDAEARNSEGIVSSPAFGGTANVYIKITLPSAITSCSGCHGYWPIDGPRSGATGAFVGSHQPHNKPPAYVCSICHLDAGADYGHRSSTIDMQPGATGINQGFYDKNNNSAYNVGVDNTWTQTNTPTLASCRTVWCHGANNPTPAWGGATPQCITCHNATVSALNAAAATSGSISSRDNVVGEFNPNGNGTGWSHTRSKSYAVTDADCIVCHLEGDSSTQKPSSKHADGYINLRDPDGATAEASVTLISGGTFSFTKFSTTYGANTRFTDGHTRDTIDNVITQKFCLRCHDANGATNPGARVGGATTSQYKPFNSTISGAGYVAPLSAGVAGGVVDVNTQFDTSNTSIHPVRGPRNSDFPSSSRLADPYKTTGRDASDTDHVLADSIVMNCFDCHNTVGRLTTRTVAAHGNAVTIMAPIYNVANATNTTTLCTICHVGYNVAPGTTRQHGAGSALAYDVRGDTSTYCYNCHGSSGSSDIPSSPSTVRPVRAQDYHGTSYLVGGGTWQWNGQGTVTPTPPAGGSKIYAFIRNTQNFYGHRPYYSSEHTGNTATCQGGSGRCAGNNRAQNYTPGGTY